jgi:hypothetical protein
MNKNITKSSESYELNELFEEYETNTIRVSDFGLTHRGVLIDYIHRDENGKISIWAGNPDTDKYAEELLPDKNERKEILEMIWENLC